MEYIVIIVVNILCLIGLAIIYDFTIYNIKKIKNLGFSKELNEITDKLPDNKDICREMLKIIHHEKEVKVVEDKNAKASLYIVLTNTISIANIKDSCSRIQTIAHECIHSIQNKKILVFNFIYSNIYIIYFVVICILTILDKIQNQMLQIYILTLLSFIHYKVRNFLEMDAMTRAPYLANEYMTKCEILPKSEIEKVMNAYKQMNSIGIKLINFSYFSKYIVKISIYCFICLI